MKQATIHATYSGRRRKGPKKVKVDCTVSKQLYESLSDAAYLYDTPIAEVVRAAIKDWLKRHYKKDSCSL